MSLDMPSALSILGVCGVIITALTKLNISRSSSYVSRETCQARYEELSHQIGDIQSSITEIRTDIKTLLRDAGATSKDK